MGLKISEEVARWQRINLNYWFSNCKCDCKSCYEMRKSIETLMRLEEDEYYETKSRD